jgi:hypothetical protein
VNDAAEEGGGPAGVVEGLFEAPNEKALWLDFLSGVAGGLEESGTWKDIPSVSRVLPQTSKIDVKGMFENTLEL